MIDERAPDVFMKQEYVESGKWKKLGDDAVKSKSNERNQSDESPPRKSKGLENRKESPNSMEMSPPRKTRNNSDESPPRRNSKPSSKRTRSPSRKANSDSSPPRRSQKPESSKESTDISPPRRQRRNSDNSPPRRDRGSRQMKIDSRDSYVPRDRRSRWSPEVKRESTSPFKHPKNRQSTPPQSSKMTRTLDGKVSGLQDAKTLKRENDAFKERQEKLFKEMRPEMSGRDADIVIRDRRGRNKEFEFEVEAERRKAEAEEARKKEYDRWGKGLKQIDDLEKRYQEHMHEASKPLARSADDEDLQNHLKHQERLDDPMLEYMRKKKEDINRKKGVEVKPKYLGQFPDNRFNIRPGYRWDGVDRSNGYEKKYFSMVNSKKSQEEEAYRYSTEDM